jgi:hypothetical protein
MMLPATVILVALAVSASGAFAQTAAPGANVAAPPAMRQQPAAPGGRRPAAAVPGANVRNLTKDECRRLGGRLQDDTKCKNAQRCVVTLANQDVRSICIDEVKHE